VYTTKTLPNLNTDDLEAIVGAVAGTVPAEVLCKSALRPTKVADLTAVPLEDEETLKAQIDEACAGEQAAIMVGDQHEAKRLGDLASALLDKYEALITAALATESMTICESAIEVEPAPSVVWVSESAGTVSIDGGENYRAFRLIGDWRQGATIKLITSAGEISSRWRTTKGNRYINAIREDLDKRLKPSGRTASKTPTI
jgi:hypothetical protein